MAAAVAREHNLVLLDGGSKMLEVSRFGPLLAQNSVFVVHDWEDETFEAGFERALDDMVPRPVLSLPPVSIPPLGSSGAQLTSNRLSPTGSEPYELTDDLRPTGLRQRVLGDGRAAGVTLASLCTFRRRLNHVSAQRFSSHQSSSSSEA